MLEEWKLNVPTEWGSFRNKANHCQTAEIYRTQDTRTSLTPRALYGCVVLRSKKRYQRYQDIEILLLAQNRAARLALHCSFKTNVTKMHRSLSWLTIKAKLTFSPFIFVQNAIVDGKLEFFTEQLVQTGLKYNHKTRQVSMDHLDVLKSKTNQLKTHL